MPSKHILINYPNINLNMSYLVCEKCGKHYKIDGKSSFDFQRCDCGGKLKYSASPNETPVKHVNQTALPAGISWKGVVVGFLFLFVSLIFSVLAIFGTDIPANPSSVSSQVLTIFTVMAVILTIVSGSIAAYTSGSKEYRKGAINGVLVGIILGFILGIAGGLLVFLSGTLIFGLLSMLGGIIGILPRRHLE